MNAIDREVDRQFQSIANLANEIVPQAELKLKLRKSITEKRPLRVKYGIDPTKPNIHIGHLVPCRAIRAFQDCGHLAVLIIGDYTARVGDPSGRDTERPRLSESDINENMKLYAQQLFRVVDESRSEVHFQSSWFGTETLDGLLDLLSNFSVAQMLSHETFRLRMEAGARLSLHELIYPALQAYDSVRIRADVEIGGSDQRFNCLCGRDLQRSVGAEPQVVVSLPLLQGTDGRKMSKSLGNHISVDLSSHEMVGKVMSIPDELLEQYVRLPSDWSQEMKDEIIGELQALKLHPREAKLRVAENIAAQFHGKAEAREAVAEFDRIFGRHEAPSKVDRRKMNNASMNIVELLVECNLATSRSEARRLIDQRGVRIDDLLVLSHEETILLHRESPRRLNVGRRRFLEVFA